MKTTVTMSAEDARALINGEYVLREIMDVSRWSVGYRQIAKLPDGRLVEINYRRGETDTQPMQPFEGEQEVTFEIVEPYVKTVIAYRPISRG